ncbi:MAG: sigma-70 family RNA polymerase sigma factor [Myxococcales bacterium]|nr:sigma-70 family RNA polymerase sigma factor [Myxococcota bacterium]MDW8282848.1 sigma-70 family RNA polymerase sigma factor [Myxococcales bacterium]
MSRPHQPGRPSKSNPRDEGNPGRIATTRPTGQSGPPASAAQQRLIEQHIPLVRSIARRLCKQMPGIDLEDLVGFGMQGLLEAAQRYDRRHGVVFSTFAYYRVRGAMFDGVRAMGWLPRGEYARLRFEERANALLENLSARASAELEAAEGKDPLEQEAEQLASALSGVATVFVTLMGSLNQTTLLDERPAPLEQIEQRQLAERLRRALSRLPDKERRLIDLYYFGDQTLEQVGAELGLSKSWTSRLHARAVALLREELLQEGICDE